MLFPARPSGTRLDVAAGHFEVDGRQLAIRNLDRVVFLQTGTTKGELLDYHIRIADAMLPHLRDRLLHTSASVGMAISSPP